MIAVAAAERIDELLQGAIVRRAVIDELRIRGQAERVLGQTVERLVRQRCRGQWRSELRGERGPAANHARRRRSGNRRWPHVGRALGVVEQAPRARRRTCAGTAHGRRGKEIEQGAGAFK